MKFTLSWLKEHLETDASIDAIEAAMILAGLEVETIDNPAETLRDFSIAKVIEAKPHPDADKLRVCTVETRDGVKQIVCGAPNARTGMTAVYAPLGAYIPGLDFSLDKKPRKIRGVESHGMMCSTKELELGEDHDGIMDLDDGLPLGAPLADVLGLNDPVIDFEVTPNRPDWLGVTGIARDLAAAGVGKAVIASVAPVKGAFPCPVEVTTDDADACPVFMGRVIRGVKNGPSPEWMQKRLKAIGVNPKNMLVDVTNYVSFDRCRPLHAYDASKLSGAIVARLGKAGEKLAALDEKTYDISGDMCVIADQSGPIGLGGVMGGAATASSLDTVDVFLESALFDPMRTARTGRATGIVSDARYRFERGVDPQSCRDGLELATRLIIGCCGGEASDIVVAGEVPSEQPHVDFKPRDMKRLTGVEMTAKRMKDILSTLGFSVDNKAAKTDDAVWKVTPPSFRRDIAQSADIVEELIRIEGFGALPLERLPRPAISAPVVTPLQNRIRIARRVMAARGFSEAVTWSFMSESNAALAVGEDGLDSALRVDNPIAVDLVYMRPTALANLAQAAQRNADHGAEEVRLFEAGPVYLGDGPKDQRSVITGLVRPRAQRHWAGASAYDAFSAKADLFALLGAMDQPGDRFQIGEAAGPLWHPGRSGTLKLGPKTTVATFGDLHPSALRALDVDGPVIGFELVLDALPAAKSRSGKTRAILEKANLTPIRRDFAFVTETSTPAGEIVRLASAVDRNLIAGARVFDVYEGPGVESGFKSVAIEVTIQPRDEALRDEDIDRLSGQVIAAVEKGAGAKLRS